MKQIIKNRYIKSWSFTSPQELSYFIGDQKFKNKLSLEDTFGTFFNCYIGFDSLTQEKLFVITFQSYSKDDGLNFMYWDEEKLFVMNSDEKIYFIDHQLNIKFSFEITTPLIGLFLISDNKLLILEEAFFRLVNSYGKILKDALFDSILAFSLVDNKLIIKTQEVDNIYILD